LAKKKKSFYFPFDVLAEIQAEAARQNRSVSWLIQRAWRIAQPVFQEQPAHHELGAPDPDA
jgi:uncharacterized small protein (TIGR04563 family)